MPQIIKEASLFEVDGSKSEVWYKGRARAFFAPGRFF
jgi:hypothetical protein